MTLMRARSKEHTVRCHVQCFGTQIFQFFMPNHHRHGHGGGGSDRNHRTAISDRTTATTATTTTTTAAATTAITRLGSCHQTANFRAR
jgi:hypothetical protein